MDNAKRYNNIKLLLNLTGTGLGWVFMAVVVFTGFSHVVEMWVLSISSSWYAGLLVFVAIIGFIEAALFFPLEFYNDYILEHKFDLSNQTLKKYFWEKGKGLIVGLIIGIPVILVFYYLLKSYQEYWWIPVGVFIFIFSIVIGRLAPVIIFPLFYKFIPITEESLSELINDRCKSVGMKVEGIYRFDMSKNTKKANAAFTGIGKSKRVILGDTLLDNFDIDEIDAVLSHELGHFKLKHLWKTVIIGTVLTFMGLYTVSIIYSKLVVSMNFDNITEFAALPLLSLLMGIYGFIIAPIQNAISRKYEHEADNFSKKLIGSSNPMVSALEKLADQNLADRRPHPVVEFLFHSHPSIDKRVELLQSY